MGGEKGIDAKGAPCNWEIPEDEDKPALNTIQIDSILGIDVTIGNQKIAFGPKTGTNEEGE